MFAWTVILLYCALQLDSASCEEDTEKNANEATTTTASEKEGSKTWIWITCALVGVIIIFIVVFFVLWARGTIQKWLCGRVEDKDIRQVAPMYGKTATEVTTQINEEAKGPTMKESRINGSISKSTVASGDSSKKAGGLKKNVAKKQKKMNGKKESGSTTNTTETQKESTTLEKASESATSVNELQVKRVDPSKEKEIDERVLDVGGRWMVVNEISSDISFDISSSNDV